MPRKSLEIAKIAQQKVLMRVDFNIPFDQGKVLDNFRIAQVLPTIKFLKEKKAAKIILISHLGRPLKRDLKLSLKPLASYLEKIVKEKVYFLDTSIGDQLLMEIKKLPLGSIILLENLRFYEEEEKNDKKFAQSLAKIADIFVNEAFSVSHRKVASLSAITEFLPSYEGILLEKELSNLNKIKENPSKPLVVILGGLKIKDKLPLIETFLEKADFILLGGVMANTVLRANDFDIGESLFEQDLSQAKKLGSQRAELILPGDFAVLDKNNQKQIRELGKILAKDKILDIGPLSSKTFSQIISQAKTIFWNGPLGKFENPKFRESAQEIIKAIINNKVAFSIIGGGETIAIFNILSKNLKIPNSIFLSTGGGAGLEYLADKLLPGVKALNKN